jgi:DNA polymerase-3 subunit alpha
MMLENNQEKFEEEKIRLANNQEKDTTTAAEKTAGGFVHLHVLTEYSLGRSVAKIKELVREAKRLGMTHLAITDAGNIHAVPLFCRECHQQGLEPIIGCELQVVCHSAPSTRTCPMVVLCCSVQGYYNLLQLITLSHTRPQPEPDQDGEEKFFADTPGHVTPAELQAHSCGLILLSGGPDSELNQLLLEGAYAQAQALVQEWQRTFYNSFFLELQEHGRPEEKAANRLLQKLGREQDLELIATNEVRYVYQEDAELLTQVQALQEHRTILDPAPAAAARHHLCSAKELAELQAAFPQALANTQTLVHSLIDSASLAYFIELGNNLDESVNLPQTGIARISSDQKLQTLCAAGLKKLYSPGELPVKERLTRELQTIFKLRQSAKFIQAYQTLQNIRQLGQQAFLEPGPVYGSLVAYLLGLTPLDPVRLQLQGEKFLYQKDGHELARSLRCCYLDNTLKISRLQACLEPLYGKGRVAPCFLWRRLPFTFFIQRLARYYQLPRETAAKLQELCCGKRPAPNLGTMAEREKFLSSIPKLRPFLQQEPLCARIFNSAYRLTGLSDRRWFRHNANLILLPPDQEPEKYLPLDRVQITTCVPCAASSGQRTSGDATSRHGSTCKCESDATLVSHYDETAVSAFGFTIFHRRHSRHLKILDKLTRSLAAKKIQVDFSRLPLDDARVFRFLNRDSLTGIYPTAGRVWHCQEIPARPGAGKF